MSSEMTRLLRDQQGYLVDPEQWNEEVARELALESDLELREEHWQVLHFMRSHLKTEGVAPDVRHVVDFLLQEGMTEKKAAKEHLFHLFPYGYMQQACKIAGFQRPRAWSTG